VSERCEPRRGGRGVCGEWNSCSTGYVWEGEDLGGARTEKKREEAGPVRGSAGGREDTARNMEAKDMVTFGRGGVEVEL
jgi:hypothetical protein